MGLKGGFYTKNDIGYMKDRPLTCMCTLRNLKHTNSSTHKETPVALFENLICQLSALIRSNQQI